MFKVTVGANPDGSVVYVSNHNSKFGHIRVEQIRSFYDKNGFLTNKKLIALIPGKVEDLKNLNYKPNQQIEGIIVVKESLEPFNTKNPEKDYKYAGETGIVCKYHDKPIYRKTIYFPDSNESDTFIQHTNKEEIKKLSLNNI